MPLGVDPSEFQVIFCSFSFSFHIGIVVFFSNLLLNHQKEPKPKIPFGRTTSYPSNPKPYSHWPKHIPSKSTPAEHINPNFPQLATFKTQVPIICTFPKLKSTDQTPCPSHTVHLNPRSSLPSLAEPKPSP